MAPRAARPGRSSDRRGHRCASAGSPETEQMCGISGSLRPPWRARLTGWLSRAARLTPPAARSYARRHVRPLESRAADDAADDPARAGAPGAGSTATAPDLAALPIAGITRRRVASSPARCLPPGSSSCSPVRSARRRPRRHEPTTSPGQRRPPAEVAALERELDLIARQRYIEQQVAAYGLGGPHEIAFALATDAPACAADAPGSAAVRIGAGARPSLRSSAGSRCCSARPTDARHDPGAHPARGSLSCPPDALAPDEGGRRRR